MPNKYKPGPPLQFERCNDCQLIHYECGVCGATRTIQRDAEMLGDYRLMAEPDAIWVLRQRADFSSLHIPICDRCWPAVQEQRIPKIDPNGYVKPKPKLFILG